VLVPTVVALASCALILWARSLGFIVTSPWPKCPRLLVSRAPGASLRVAYVGSEAAAAGYDDNEAKTFRSPRGWDSTILGFNYFNLDTRM